MFFVSFLERTHNVGRRDTGARLGGRAGRVRVGLVPALGADEVVGDVGLADAGARQMDPRQAASALDHGPAGERLAAGARHRHVAVRVAVRRVRRTVRVAVRRLPLAVAAANPKCRFN